MKQYFSIAELQRFTGIKAHTFRTWEQRFDVLKSKRKGNQLRYYTLDDLEYFLDFSLLNRFGYKVSRLVTMDREELRETTFMLNDEMARKENIIRRLIVYMFSFETDSFESTLNHAIGRYGIEDAMENVIIEFIERVDLFSYKGNSSAEYHFAITVLRKKIIGGIEQVKVRKRIPKTALLFLPEGEHFDLLLLYIHYTLQHAGVKSFYLGTNIQTHDLLVAIEKKQPDLLITYLHHEDKKSWSRLQSYLPSIKNELLLVAKPVLRLDECKPGDGTYRFAQYRSIANGIEQMAQHLEVV